MKSFRLTSIAALALGLSVTPGVPAFNLGAASWPQPQAEFIAAFADNPEHEALWQKAMASAAEAWNQRTAFSFEVVAGEIDPCRLPSNGAYQNGAAFSLSRCGGLDFSPGTLAVTMSWSIDGELVQTGILFNAKHHLWDVYDGPWRSDIADFGRVAVHELGHAAGLRHEIDKPAIMAPRVGDLLVPQHDDAEGIESLYQISPLLNTGFEPGSSTKSQASTVAVDAFQELTADFDGDGLPDQARWRAIDGLWEIRTSGDERTQRLRLGGPGQEPQVADFNADGRADPAVRNRATGAITAWPLGAANPLSVASENAVQHRQ